MQTQRTQIGVIGVGRLGICMALSFEQAGYDVFCVDKNASILESIKNKSIVSYEPCVEDLLAQSQHLHIASLEETVQACDIFFVVVATPTLPNNSYDHQYIEEVVEKVISCGPQETTKTMVISCTVMPRYCDSLVARLGEVNVKVCYNPEFIAQGNILYGFEHPDIVLIGANDSDTADCVSNIYKSVCKNDPTYCIMSLTEAELTKISLNCYITMKIAYANMVGNLAFKAGCDPQVVLNAISKDERVGSKCMKYGYGYGGPCFPRDNLALQAFAKTQGIDMILSASTDVANAYHLEQMYTTYTQKYSKNDIITFDSITYKPESVIVERSFPLQLALKLVQNGYTVHIHERAYVIEQVHALHGDIFTYTSRPHM